MTSLARILYDPSQGFNQILFTPCPRPLPPAPCPLYLHRFPFTHFPLNFFLPLLHLTPCPLTPSLPLLYVTPSNLLRFLLKFYSPAPTPSLPTSILPPIQFTLPSPFLLPYPSLPSLPLLHLSSFPLNPSNPFASPSLHAPFIPTPTPTPSLLAPLNPLLRCRRHRNSSHPPEISIVT